MSVLWRAAARADVIRIIRYIADENPVAARQVARELVLAGDSLAMFPRRGRRGRAQGTRELVVVQPYIPDYSPGLAGIAYPIETVYVLVVEA